MVPTPKGDARLVVRRAKRPLAMLVLTHGAGGGIDAPDLLRLARTLPQQDISVALVEMPWRVAGKKLAPAPPVIDECFTAVLDDMRTRSPLVLGGRSAGARSACRIARGVGARGVLALSFPLHPPGQAGEVPARRAPAAPRVPTLVVQGERDPFGTPEEFPDGIDLAVVPAADHSLKVPEVRGRSARPRRWPSCSRRRWSGWCARSPGIETTEDVFLPWPGCAVHRP